MSSRSKSYQYQLDKLKQERERHGINAPDSSVQPTAIDTGINAPDQQQQPDGGQDTGDGWSLDGKPNHRGIYDDDPYAPGSYTPPFPPTRAPASDLWHRNNPRYVGHIDGGKIQKKLNNKAFRRMGFAVRDEDEGYCVPPEINGW